MRLLVFMTVHVSSFIHQCSRMHRMNMWWNFVNVTTKLNSSSSVEELIKFDSSLCWWPSIMSICWTFMSSLWTSIIVHDSMNFFTGVNSRILQNPYSLLLVPFFVQNEEKGCRIRSKARWSCTICDYRRGKRNASLSESRGTLFDQAHWALRKLER